MRNRIKRVGVVGAGVMGAAIAAQMANVDIDVLLLDIVPPALSEQDIRRGITKDDPEFRNRFSRVALERALKSKPAAFYIPENSKRITIGNLEDDLEGLKDMDWIIEAIVENLDIKRTTNLSIRVKSLVVNL